MIQGHSAVFTHSKGKTKVNCSCGEQTPMLDSAEDARKAHEAHVTWRAMTGKHWKG